MELAQEPVTSVPLSALLAAEAAPGAGSEFRSLTASARRLTQPEPKPASRAIRTISRRLFAPSRPWAFYRWVAAMTLTTFAVALMASLTISFGSPLEAMRHLAAMPNCAAAATVGVPRPLAGEPGYWPWLDEDKDGKACEPYLKAS